MACLTYTLKIKQSLMHKMTFFTSNLCFTLMLTSNINPRLDLLLSYYKNKLDIISEKYLIIH